MGERERERDREKERERRREREGEKEREEREKTKHDLQKFITRENIDQSTQARGEETRGKRKETQATSIQSLICHHIISFFVSYTLHFLQSSLPPSLPPSFPSPPPLNG